MRRIVMAVTPVTHIGSLRKLSGERITPSERDRMFRALDYCVVLVHGDWCYSLLWCGFDSKGARCWQRWHAPKLSASTSTFSPIPSMSSNVRKSLAPRLVDLFRTPDTTLEWILSFYLDANGAGAENGVILGQVGLELLAWRVFVEQEAGLNS